jgi:alkanesulfonate monooxygenase SsuD/methylene tetrahydromethanopterin reductase-like flavin-dependent oxidoreductase (luciferase family)
MLNDRKIKLGLSMRYFGYHVAAWRHPDARADGAVHFDYFLKSAIKAEAAKLDMIFFADGLGIRASDEPAGSLCRDMRNVELEPLTLLAALGVCTRHIGLVATASTTYDEPLHVARKFTSIDHISGGREGWNVVTSWSGRKPGIFSTPAEVVDDLQHWFESGAADRFNICPATLPQGIDDLAELVIPEMRRRGLFRTEYEGTALWQNLGLNRVVFGA